MRVKQAEMEHDMEIISILSLAEGLEDLTVQVAAGVEQVWVAVHAVEGRARALLALQQALQKRQLNQL